MTATFDQAIIPSNRLLRKELSAVGTYTQALSLFRMEPARALLKAIRSNHEDNAAILRAHIDDMGGDPDNHSGVRGQLAKAVEGVAKIFGETATIMGLEAGELACRDDCLRTLADPEVMEEMKDDIRAILLPRIERHRQALRLLKSR
jgi:hypothetical protein